MDDEKDMLRMEVDILKRNLGMERIPVSEAVRE